MVVSGALLFVEAGYVVSALLITGAPPAVYRSLLSAPRAVLWKVGLWSRVLTRPDDVRWVRTARNAEADPGDGPEALANER